MGEKVASSEAASRMRGHRDIAKVVTAPYPISSLRSEIDLSAHAGRGEEMTRGEGKEIEEPMSEQAHTIAQVDTPLGPVLLHVAESESLSVVADIAEMRPELPAGMRVDRALRIDLKLRASKDVDAVQFSFALDADLEGSPESGEWLDSIRFRSQGTQLSLGTRDTTWMLSHGVDAKYLPQRLRADLAAADFSAWSLRYRPQGFVIEVAALKRGDTLTCPLALAFASAQPDNHDDESTWFAVDYSLP